MVIIFDWSKGIYKIFMKINYKILPSLNFRCCLHLQLSSSSTNQKICLCMQQRRKHIISVISNSQSSPGARNASKGVPPRHGNTEWWQNGGTATAWQSVTASQHKCQWPASDTTRARAFGKQFRQHRIVMTSGRHGDSWLKI